MFGDQLEFRNGVRLDGRESDARRDRAIDRAEIGADDEWKEAAYEAVRLTCLEHDDFIIDQVWLRVDEMPREGRAMGAVMRRAVRSGLCERTDQYRKSRRPQCHSRPCVVWRSKLRERGRVN